MNISNLRSKKAICKLLTSVTQKEVQSVARYINDNFSETNLSRGFYTSDKKDALIEEFRDETELTFAMLMEAVKNVLDCNTGINESDDEEDDDFFSAPQKYLKNKNEICNFLKEVAQKDVQDFARYFNDEIPAEKLSLKFNVSAKKEHLILAFTEDRELKYEMLLDAFHEIYDDTEAGELDEEYDYYPETYSNFSTLPSFCEIKSKYNRYEHQEDCYNQLTKLIKFQNEKRVLLNVPTGGGKTRIANDFIYDHYLSKGKTVLWITFKGILLRQAWSDIVERFNFESIGRCCNTPEIKQLPESLLNTKLNYTSIQSLKNDYGIISRLKPDLIIVDEVHWGEEGKMAKELYKKAKNIPILGLSATPNDKGHFENHVTVNYFELMESKPQILARPDFLHVETGIYWTPRFKNGVLDKSSLKDLGKDTIRNKKIIDTYKDSLGKTLVFACSIEQAEELARQFNNNKTRSAAAYHSKMEGFRRIEVLQSFKEGRVQILIGVDALTHGFDVPEIKTIIMARPTESAKLYAQMIGRGSRITSDKTKTSFNIIEFTDNIEKYADMFCNEESFFGSARKSYEVKKRKIWPVNHFYDNGQIRLIKEVPELPELDSLPYRTIQTFGAEFELTCEEFNSDNFTDEFFLKNAKELISSLKKEFGSESVCSEARIDPTQTKDYNKWCVEKDSSCGWEITTPILHNLDGFIELQRGLKVINEVCLRLNLIVNHKTGTHIHLGYRLNREDQLIKLVEVIRYIEPALSAFVSPSRVLQYEGNDEYDFDQTNGFCVPLSFAFSSDWIKCFKASKTPLAFFNSYNNSQKGIDNTKYLTMNLNNIESDKGTVEIRWHNGTLDFKKISVWISLWMLLLNKAPHIVDDIPTSDCKIPIPFTNGDKDFDIFFKENFLNLQPEIISFLKARWDESKINWETRVNCKISKVG